MIKTEQWKKLWNLPIFLRILSGVVVLSMLFLYACYRNFPTEEKLFQFYYVNDYHSTGRALKAIPRYLPETKDEIQWLTLMEAHLSFALEPDVHSPFPNGTRLLTTKEEIPQIADVYFSSEYGELSGIDKTMADYAVVETLCQLPTVTAVRIFVQGKEEIPPILRSTDTELLETPSDSSEIDE